MAFRIVTSFYGAVATAVGFVLMGWGPMFLKYLGNLVHNDFGSYSLIRLAGVGFFLVGALLLCVRTIVHDSRLQRAIATTMAATHVVGALILLAQQIAIWESPLGAVLTGWMWVAGASFAVTLIPARRPAGVRA
jgi:hypothetical protein